jgi:uncharacterized membrane protein YcaP (DUF421 family)
MNHIFLPALPLWDLLLRATIVFVAVLLMLRIAGKRQVAQMGMAEFVALLLISNAVQNSMNGGDNSLTGGVILAAAILVLGYLFQYATFRSRKLERLVQGAPTLLIHHGKLLPDNLRHELLSIRELRAMLRKQGIHDLHDVEEAVLESDGFISITKKAEAPEMAEWQRSDIY